MCRAALLGLCARAKGQACNNNQRQVEQMLRATLIASALACAASAAFAQQQPAAPAPAPAPPVETCGVLGMGGETSSFSPLEGYSLLSATPPLVRPAGDVDAILCIRSGIYLGPNDYRVITDLHVPLFIRDADSLAVLEPANGQLSIRFVRGRPTAEEAQALGAAIDRAHQDMARASRASRRGH